MYNVKRNIVQKHKTRRTVVSSDCAGAGMALNTSRLVPYHSMVLTSPYLDVLHRDSVFEERYKATNISLDLCNDIYNKYSAAHIDEFNCTRALENFVSNPNVHVSIHWSNKIYGSDLMFRNSVMYLEKKLNFVVVEHDTPVDTDPHILLKWLQETKQHVPLVMEALRNEFIALNYEVLHDVANKQ
jgi:hypothetical protein